MEALEQLRQRLDTFDELGAIVRTMKALATVSIRQYELAVQALVDYNRTVELGLQVVLRDMPAPPHVPHAPDWPVAAIVFGSDYGLCGRFNEDLADYARERLAEACAGQPRGPMLAVGGRIAALLNLGAVAMDDEIPVPASAERITETVRTILLKIDQWQAEAETHRVFQIHNRPISSGSYHPIGVQMMPINLRHFSAMARQSWPGRSLPTHSMDRERLFAALLRQYFFVSLFRACAESLAAENASRLAAMQAAEKNLQEQHEALRTSFRRRRQEAITAELLDIVSGYEAMRARS